MCSHHHSYLAISIHVPAWGTTFLWIRRTCLSAHFNPRSRVGNDMLGYCCSSYQIQFQSTFPRGERRLLLLSLFSYYRFQSTFPRGERLLQDKIFFCASQFQSTFPRGERQIISMLESSISTISIHVPAWGTTKRCKRAHHTVDYFNPRSRVGNDWFPSLSVIIPLKISIHVPAWGTTTMHGETLNSM